MNSAAYVSIILGCCVLWVACSFPVALSCDSCGRECASACGTRHFRTCCFNYLRKRSSTPPRGPIGTDKRLELWYATKSAGQNSRANHRRLSNFLLNNADSDIDYEYIPIVSPAHLAVEETQTATRKGVLGNPSVIAPELDESRSMEQTNEKSSEESQPAPLQLLYES
uniref:Trissin n=1 Tax=Anopheles dirus TaxID=7168 RepID=A0A182NYC3_9DIPT